MALVWKPIQELPEDWKILAQSELESLASVWKEQAARLKNSNAWRHFSDRLR